MLYDLLLFFLLLTLFPKTFGKKQKRKHHYLRFFLPKEKLVQKAIWIHGVSLGEIHAAKALISAVKKNYPNAKIVVSSSTNTGIQAARKLQGIAGCFLLPFDFSFLVRPLLRALQPKVLLLVEADYWKNLLYYTKKANAKIFLVSGKMSAKSEKRFLRVGFWSRKIFSYFDGIFLQNKEYEQRFLQFACPDIVRITGNIKYATSYRLLSKPEKLDWQARFGINPQDPVITIASSHDPEEKMLLEKCLVLWKKFPTLQVLLAPRHPERFSYVADYLHKKKIPFSRYTSEEKILKQRCMLIDTMGLLSICYQLSNAAVVCGSYIEKIGGHNVLEPNIVHTPVFYGPYMQAQKDLQTLVETAQSGQTLFLNEFVPFFTNYLQDAQKQSLMQNSAKTLCVSLQTSAMDTISTLKNFGAFAE